MSIFVAIVDHGSLSAAARALRKAQPTVVRSLALLEDSLGVRLLQRTTRRMSLTPEGESYLERCRQILGDLEEVEELLVSRSAHLRGKIRITAPMLFGQLHVAPAIADFLKCHPQVRVELVLLDRVVNLVEEGFDLGVRIALLEDSSLVAKRVGYVVRTCVASPALLQRVGFPRHPAELSEFPTVTFSQGALGAFKFQENGKLMRRRMDSLLVTNQARAAIEACERGLGVGQFLSYQVEAGIRSGRLVRVLAGFEPPETPVHIVFAHARLLSARQRALVDCLKEALARGPLAPRKKRLLHDTDDAP